MKGGQRRIRGLRCSIIIAKCRQPTEAGLPYRDQEPPFGAEGRGWSGTLEGWVREDFLEEVVRGTYREGWDGSLVGEVDLEQGPGGAA